MTRYLVTWEIDMDARSPEEAALKAWRAMRRRDSTANVFDVWGEEGYGGAERTRVDLQELAETRMVIRKAKPHA